MFELLVFDLDFTLWDAGGTWCDHTHPPYRIEDKRILDRYDAHIRLYPEVPSILQKLQQAGIPMALASRTGEPSWARKLLQLFEINDYFPFQEIYPSSKLKHFQSLHQATHIPYEKMLFFDDEHRNIEEVGRLGVTCVWVPDGLNKDLLKEHLSFD